jgi:phage terminase large subunit
LRSAPRDYDNIWEGRPKSVVDGAIYATEYMQLVEEGRIAKVSHDPYLKAHAIFDLGWNDAMSIVVCQRAGSELRILDYIEDTHQTLDWYSARLKSLGYNWGSLWLPHDGVTKDYKTGKSAQELLQAMDWRVEIIPIGEVEHGIRLARAMFPRVWMDRDKTKGLQECLKRYRRRINQQTQQPEGPLHDEYSHGADAFRYVATCVDMLRNDNPGKKRRDPGVAYNGTGREGAWMG